MTPEEIGVVVTMWQDASTPRILMVVAVADGLSGPLRSRVVRAQWITDAVSLLSTVLHRPAVFTELAADVLASRVPVTTEALADDREALLGALTELLGPLCPCERRAWTLAINLFAEIVSGACLDPFDIHPQLAAASSATLRAARPGCDETCGPPSSTPDTPSPGDDHELDRHHRPTGVDPSDREYLRR